MPKYIISNIERCVVEADSAQQALDSFHVRFLDVPASALPTDPEAILPTDWFDYLDGSTTVEEKEEEN